MPGCCFTCSHGRRTRGSSSEVNRSCFYSWQCRQYNMHCGKVPPWQSRSSSSSQPPEWLKNLYCMCRLRPYRVNDWIKLTHANWLICLFKKVLTIVYSLVLFLSFCVICFFLAPIHCVFFFFFFSIGRLYISMISNNKNMKLHSQRVTDYQLRLLIIV